MMRNWLNLVTNLDKLDDIIYDTDSPSYPIR